MGTVRLHGVAVYNPGLLSREELKSYFVARTKLLSRILDSLRRERPGGHPQHRLVLGLRGMGKSTLLRRISIAVEEDKELSRQWLPLTFPEEQYNISTPGDLWINCLDALSDALEDRGAKEKATTLDTAIELLPQNDAGAAFNLLLAEASKLDLRLLLLIDNIDLVLERLMADHWGLREILQSESQLMIIGASAKAIEASYQYDAAFYDFFKIDELKGLSESETSALLIRLAELSKTPHVVERMKNDPARLKTLYTLIGGNPRTTVLLYNILAQGQNGDVRSDLEGLLDLVTPFYKARLEELPQQAQQLVDGLAVNWDPMTAKQLAQKLGWNVNNTSSQLNRLQQQAIVEKVKPADGKRAAFQISERFFNIWYLMRSNRRARHKLVWLVYFLRMFFSAQELQDHARRKKYKWEDCHSQDTVLHPQGEDFDILKKINEILTQALEKEKVAFGLINDGSEEYSESTWLIILTLFKEAVRSGRAKEALQVVENTAVAERWRPLREALAAAAAENSQWLNGVAPEIRVPALQILREIAPDLPIVSQEI